MSENDGYEYNDIRVENGLVGELSLVAATSSGTCCYATRALLVHCQLYGRMGKTPQSATKMVLLRTSI